MSTVTIPTTVPAQRRRALEPYLTKLRTWNQRIPGVGTGRAAAVVIGRQRLSVESWERRIISDWGESEPDEAARLVLEGLAAMAKSLTDMEELDKGESDSRDVLYRRQAELLLDSAIVTALLREVRRAIDGAVAVGGMEQARWLTSLQHRMHRVQSQATERLTESNLPRVQTLADSLTEIAGPPSAAPEIGDAELLIEVEGLEQSREEVARPPRVARSRRAAGSPERPSAAVSPATPKPLPAETEQTSPLTGFLAVLAATAIVLWAFLVALPEKFDDRRTLVTGADFPHAEAYLQIAARPPSLFVDVDPALWERLAEPERFTRIREISSVVSPLGYDGLLLRGPAGEPLGQWVRGRGIQLLDGALPEVAD